jgi:perosamine synthetase
MIAQQISLRPACEADEERLFAWRNRPEIVALGSSRQTVERAQHRAWFAETLAGERRSLYVIEGDGHPVGQVRFDWHARRRAEVSIYLLSEFTGRGLGVAALREGCRCALASGRADSLVARIRHDNPRSRAAFAKVGFVASNEDQPLVGYDTLVCHKIAPTVPHNRLTHSVEEEQAVARVVRSGRWAGGVELAELERRLALLAGVAHAVGVGSGVGALRLSLLALGVGRGDRVAVPAYSCVALPNAVLACGAQPVPVDVSPDTLNISVAALHASLAVQPRLKAVIAVHTFGSAAPVRELTAFGVPVVEDCSHAFGRGSLGGLGRVAMLSLYATKLLGAGEGGMILTDDAAVADQVRAARDYADQAPSAHRLNDKLTDLAAALALCQLDRLPRSLVRRTELAQRYTAQLAACAAEHDCALPVDEPNRVWYRYAAAVPDAAEVIASLAAQGIATARPVENWGGATSASTPIATRAYDQLVSLPLYPTLTEAEQDLVCAAFIHTLSVACHA